MKWHSESTLAWSRRIQKWHRWFAWHPVRIEQSMVWLETVDRIGEVYFTPYNDPFALYTYRTPQKEDK